MQKLVCLQICSYIHLEARTKAPRTKPQGQKLRGKNHHGLKAPTDKSHGGQKPQLIKGTHMSRTVESAPGTKFRGRLVPSKTFAGINFRGHFAKKNSFIPSALPTFKVDKSDSSKNPLIQMSYSLPVPEKTA